ncbi:MAG: DUF1573 domain-containing protein [Saprospiraceae bacterium]|nr:DUF1573 domain-containing protein [Saprospiraceae bacterium]
MKTKIFKKAFLFVSLFSFLSLGVFAQVQAPTASPAPVGPTTTIEFEADTYEFGTTVEGSIVSHVFTFTNTGEKPFILSNAKGSCGCTVPKWPKEPIAPGETASISVEFNTKAKHGHQVKKITLTGNVESAQIFLYIKGEVLPADMDDLEREAGEEIVPSPECFAIYPNPTAEILKLDFNESNIGQLARISIVSMSGQIMAKREFKVESKQVEFDVSHYLAGTYIANVQIGEAKPETKCFVVVD